MQKAFADAAAAVYIILWPFPVLMLMGFIAYPDALEAIFVSYVTTMTLTGAALVLLYRAAERYPVIKKCMSPPFAYWFGVPVHVRLDEVEFSSEEEQQQSFV